MAEKITKEILFEQLKTIQQQIHHLDQRITHIEDMIGTAKTGRRSNNSLTNNLQDTSIERIQRRLERIDHRLEFGDQD